jgi:small subunit ribosomal protein S8
MGVSTDTIADYLTQLRNASRALKENVTIKRGSNMMVSISEILKQEGFIQNFKVVQEGPKKLIRIHLKYKRGKKSAIQSLVRISKPGCRRYVASTEIPTVLGGLGLSILSTSKGVMSGRKARAEKVGGEFLCKVW